ncbi:MAG: glycosyltransferase, partial [Bacillota bacterium]|nr:glycosyltransferase [Bacillota bacterium]
MVGKIDIVYSSSDLYAQCTGVSLLSLLHNNQDVEELNIHVIDTDISFENKKKINAIAQSFGRNINFISAKQTFENEIKSMNLKILRGAYNTYSRLKLNTWFKNLDKILVIDSDTLVVGSLKELWEIDLKDNLIAAVPEIGVYLPNNTFDDINIINLNEFYYNAGIGI